jgi:hypothetical protein
MRASKTQYTGHPWRIHEITGDFTVEDVWTFRTPGAGPDDFPVMLAAMRNGGSVDKLPGPAKLLMDLRWKLGALLRLDGAESGVGSRVASLRDRLPADVPRGPESELTLQPVYELEREAARELANKTVHTVMHLGWAQGPQEDYELRMAVLVKPNGRFGRAYMAFIAPFRYLIVYPALTRHWERAWLKETGQSTP